MVLNSTTEQLSFSIPDLSLSSFNKAIGCTSLGASGQVSLLGGLISTTGSSHCAISSTGLNVCGSGDITCTSGIVSGLGLTTAGVLTTGSITCSGNAVITGILSGTGITTLLGLYYSKSYIGTPFYTQAQLNTTLGSYSTKATSEASYQMILTNGTEATGTYATILSTFTANSLKYITGDSNISIMNGMSYNGTKWVDEHVLVQPLPAITCDTLNATTGLISNSIMIGGSTSSATVAVMGSGEFSQDFTAKSIRLTGAQLPIYNTLDVVGSCNISGDCNMASTCEVGGLFSAFSGALINKNCTMSSVLTVPTISPPIASGLTLNGFGTSKIAIGNTVAVTGNVSMPGYLFAAGVVSSTGTKLTSTGQVSYTSSRLSAGVYQITFATAHPLGVNYIVNATAQGYMSYLRSDGTSMATSTLFQFVTYTVNTILLTDAVFSFMVLAS